MDIPKTELVRRLGYIASLLEDCHERIICEDDERFNVVTEALSSAALDRCNRLMRDLCDNVVA